MSIVCLIAVGVAAIVYESQISANDAYYVIRPGSYAAAGGLALAAVIGYIIGLLASVPFLLALFQAKAEQEEACGY
jgi:cytosine/uracil/thiamine/allantoin permease